MACGSWVRATQKEVDLGRHLGKSYYVVIGRKLTILKNRARRDEGPAFF